MDRSAEEGISQTHWPLVLGEANEDIKAGCMTIQGHGTQTVKNKCTTKLKT